MKVQFEWATMLFWRACASRIIGGEAFWKLEICWDVRNLERMELLEEEIEIWLAFFCWMDGGLGGGLGGGWGDDIYFRFQWFYMFYFGVCVCVLFSNSRNPRRSFEKRDFLTKLSAWLVARGGLRFMGLTPAWFIATFTRLTHQNQVISAWSFWSWKFKGISRQTWIYT